MRVLSVSGLSSGSWLTVGLLELWVLSIDLLLLSEQVDCFGECSLAETVLVDVLGVVSLNFLLNLVKSLHAPHTAQLSSLLRNLV